MSEWLLLVFELLLVYGRHVVSFGLCNQIVGGL